MKKILVSLLVWLALQPVVAQVGFNANSSVPAYTSSYLFGSNAGYYPSWNIYAMADIEGGNTGRNIPGAGIKSMHQPLPEQFFNQWGYDIYLDLFAYYKKRGLVENAVWFEGPTAAHKDNTIYPGCTEAAKIWSNLYTPIWDGGANGTPVNENNYLALYIYNTVTRYKQWVKFWEITNEPDFDNGNNGWRSPGDPGNWWDNNPTACELQNLKAPIFNYVRMLRITYEVVKTVDPTAYVSMGGVGYPSFLDAMLRNTDNPSDGTVTSDYPLAGGAYFDCMSFHYYPMFDLVGSRRHSDEAVAQYISRKNTLNTVLTNRGYNGTVYPKKIFICTENNVSRKPFGGYIGGDEVQRNYDMKAIIASQLNDISQMYIFSIGDNKDYADATDPFDVVGLYQNLVGKGPGPNSNDTVGPYLQQYNSSGIAYKTFSDQLSGFSADLAKTAQLGLPGNVRGGAFKNTLGDYKYILWAATTTDNSEVSAATYAFPAVVNMPAQVYQRGWNFSQTKDSLLVSSQNISLTGSPLIIAAPMVITALYPDSVRASQAAYFSVSLYPNPVEDRLTIKLHLNRKLPVSIKITDGNGQLLMKVADNATSYNTGDNLINVSLPSRLAPGIYYCRVLAGGNREQTFKFIVTK